MGELGGYIFRFKVNWDGKEYKIGKIILPEELSAKIEENELEIIADVHNLKDDTNERILEHNIGSYTFKFHVTYDEDKIVLSKIILPEELLTSKEKDMEDINIKNNSGGFIDQDNKIVTIGKIFLPEDHLRRFRGEEDETKRAEAIVEEETKEMIMENKFEDYNFKNKVTFDGNIIKISKFILPDNLAADLEEKERLKEGNNERKHVTDISEEEKENKSIVETKLGDYTFKQKLTFDRNSDKIGKVILSDNLIADVEEKAVEQSVLHDVAAEEKGEVSKGVEKMQDSSEYKVPLLLPMLRGVHVE